MRERQARLEALRARERDLEGQLPGLQADLARARRESGYLDAVAEVERLAQAVAVPPGVEQAYRAVLDAVDALERALVAYESALAATVPALVAQEEHAHRAWQACRDTWGRWGVPPRPPRLNAFEALRPGLPGATRVIKVERPHLAATLKV